MNIAVNIIAWLAVSVSRRLGWGKLVATSFFLTLVIVAVSLGLLWRGVEYPEGGGTLAHHHTMLYLVAAASEHPSDLSNAKGGIFGSHLPIVSEKDFPRLAKKLRFNFRKAADSRLFHVIVVGGRSVRDVDEPLLKAAKGLRNSSQANVELVIVQPSTVSARTKAILESKGIEVRLIGPPSGKR